MRGIAWSTLFGLVLALLLVAFAGALIFGTNPALIAEHSICSNTGNALRMFSYFDGVTVASPDDTSGILELCKPRVVSIPERASDAVINRRVGDELVICQNSFGGGQVNLFRDEARGSQTRYCGLCAKIDFEEDFPAEGQERFVEGFEEHLATYVVPGTDQTVGQILNSDLPRIDELETIESGEIDADSLSQETSLLRGEDLVVLYVYDKNASRFKNVFEAVTVGAVGGLTAGAAPSRKMGRAVVARIGVRVAGRAAGWLFGAPVMAVGEVVTTGVSIFALVRNDDLYTDEWYGGVMMVPWSWLVEEDGSGQPLSSVLACQQYMNFIEEGV